MKNIRNLKVTEQSGYRYKPTPQIQLKGQWLKEIGFDAETPIEVRCEQGRLIITKREIVEEPVMCVAESKARYGRR